MTSNTQALDFHAAAGEANESGATGLFDRAFNRFIEARVAHGRRRVNAHLARHSDQHLLGLGLTPERIAEIRSAGEQGQGFTI